MWLTFSGVEDAVGLGVAHVAALRLAVMLQGAGLTEVVPAPGTQESLRLRSKSHT